MAGNGFVAISTEKAAEPILGYSTENGFSFDQMPENLNGFLAEYSGQIAAIADQKIKANSTIVPYVPVIFDAGKDITFLPGFLAQTGCDFSAIIDGCDGNFDAKNAGADRAEKG